MSIWPEQTANAETTSGPVMLVVGHTTRPALSKQLVGPGIHVLSYAQLDRARLDQIRPDIVVAALMSPVIDALDLAERLNDLGFTGRFWALASALPKVPMVREEIHSIAPNIAFDIVTLAALSEFIQGRPALRQVAL